MANVISKNQKVPGFDEIVFDHRNKEYGAYVLRRQYRRNLLISMLIGVLIMAILVIIPFLNARADDSGPKNIKEISVIINAMEKPLEKVVVPEEQPRPKEEMKVEKFVPPEVVDTVSDKDFGLMTAEEQSVKVVNDTVIDLPVEIKPEVEDQVKEQEPFIVVEEPPVFPGGLEALLRYVATNVVYPEICRENNIQGRVIVKFCVTATGGVSMISILKGIDPELDREAMRVVSTLPAFKPGKQGGRPVPVWFMLPVLFKLDVK
ncbi:MAG TPA: TonB family protein [Bacteroidales bacterium]|jgi:protein TonB|nr:TonB family protein [Bacteroidales bacterium]